MCWPQHGIIAVDVKVVKIGYVESAVRMVATSFKFP